MSENSPEAEILQGNSDGKPSPQSPALLALLLQEAPQDFNLPK